MRTDTAKAALRSGGLGTPRSRIYFTIDTETSMAGAWHNPQRTPLPLDVPVFGKSGTNEYGIPLMMDILDAYGFKGTFFTEVFCSYVLGKPEVLRTFEYIRKRGHDAQLHLHPVYWFYYNYLRGGERRERDLMHSFPPEEQDELIGHGAALFEEFAGVRPRAYRAGCYGASETTLDSLRKHGIGIDSSYNLCYLDRTCGFQARTLNGPCIIGGVQEFPVTTFSVQFQGGYKPLEVGAVSVSETLAAIDALRRAGCYDVVISLHSFSFLRDLHDMREVRPNTLVIRRFEKLCSTIAQSLDTMEVAVMGEADMAAAPLQTCDYVPCAGWARPLARKIVQGLNRMAVV